MAKSNWKANPGPQNEAGEVNQSRGKEARFSAGNKSRKTAKHGGASMVPNDPVQSEVTPMGKPKK